MRRHLDDYPLPMFLRGCFAEGEAEGDDEGGGGSGDEDGADKGESSQDGNDAWYAGIEDERLREAVSRFEGQNKALEALGYKAPEWREAIQDEKLRDHAGRFTSLEELVKGNLELRQERDKLKSAAILRPGKDATPEDIAAFNRQLGALEKAEDYEALFPPPPEGQELPEDEKAAQAQWAAKFHELGVTKTQVEGLLKTFAEAKAAGEKAMAKEDDAAFQEAESRLKSEWGADFDTNKIYAVEAIKHLELESLKELADKNDRLVLDNPAMLRALAKIGREMDEGRIGTLSDDVRSTLTDQIEAKQKQIEEAQAKGDNAAANRLYQEKLAMIAKRDGDQPLVGVQGRAA